MSVLEIRGGLLGFQFVCAQSGVRFIDVDPFVDYGTAESYAPDTGIAFHY